jgi:hypothetical protein
MAVVCISLSRAKANCGACVAEPTATTVRTALNTHRIDFGGNAASEPFDHHQLERGTVEG